MTPAKAMVPVGIAAFSSEPLRRAAWWRGQPGRAQWRSRGL